MSLQRPQWTHWCKRMPLPTVYCSSGALSACLDLLCICSEKETEDSRDGKNFTLCRKVNKEKCKICKRRRYKKDVRRKRTFLRIWYFSPHLIPPELGILKE